MAIDEYGGYYYNSNLPQHWGQGQQYSSDAACRRACKDSGDSGCGACGYSEPPRVEKPAVSDEGITSQKTANDDVVKYFIIGGIILLLLSWS